MSALASLLLLFSFDAAADEETHPPWPLSLFGQRYMKEAELAAEVTVGKVYNLGMGVDVVKVELGKVIFNRLPPVLARRKEHLVLAYRDEFQEGTQLFLILKRFGRGERLHTLHRLSHLEKHYTDKINLMAEYIAIEMQPKGPERIGSFVSLLFHNLEHRSPWYRSNSVYELEGLLEQKRFAFTTGDVDLLRNVDEACRQKEEKPGDRAFRESLAQLIEAMAAVAVEGPASVDPEPAEEVPGEESSNEDAN